MRPHTRIVRVRSLFAASVALIVAIALAHPRGWQVAAFAAAAPQQTTRLSFAAEFPAAAVGRPYMQSVKASGGAGGYKFVEVGTLPPGMQWVPAGDGLLLSGTPTKAGEYPLRVLVNDAEGQQITRDVAFKVTANDTGATVPVTINETLTTTDAVNVLLPVRVNINETLTTTDAVHVVAVTSTNAALTPTSQDFGSDPVGSISPSSQQTFTLTNTGQTVLNSTAVSFTGTNASSFVLVQNGCSASLAVAGTCSIYVLFEPAATGPLSATLNVTSTSSAATVTQTSSLTGTGLPGPSLNVTPDPVSFPGTAINTSASSISMTLTNTGNGTLRLNGAQVGTLSGPDAAYFTFYAISCGYGGVAAGQSCSASVAFTPDAARTFNATLTITSNDPTSPAVIPLTGTGGSGTSYVFVVNGAGNMSSLYSDGSTQSSAVPGGGIGAAVDANGYVWSIDGNGSSVSAFTTAGALGSSYSPSGLTVASALAIDGNDNVIVANGNGTVVVVSNAGTAVSTTQGSTIAAPTSVAIDNSGNIWLANAAANTLDEVIGGAAPAAPLATAVRNGTPGAKP